MDQREDDIRAWDPGVAGASRALGAATEDVLSSDSRPQRNPTGEVDDV